jgi:SPP1 gp7 family putative phage head morphogenesis protein
MPDINDIVDRQRELLAARDKTLLDQISSDYQKIISRIFDDYNALQDKIDAAQAAGEDFSPSWLFRRDRLGDLLGQAQKEFDRFSYQATAATSKEQLAQIILSETHTFEMIDAGFAGGSAAARFGQTFNRLPTRAVEGLVGRASDGSPLKELFDNLGPALGQGLRDELIQAVAIGQAPRTTAQRIRDLVAGNEARAQLIARTETIQAYREGAHLTSLENDDVLDGWIWITALDGRACAACVALNGSFHKLDERMACHPACRCTKRFDTKSFADLGIKGIGETRPPPVETGATWFAGVSRETQSLILGKRGAQAYVDGDVKLSYFVGLREDSRWGRSYFQRAFKDAILGPQPGVVINYTPFAVVPPPPILPPPKPPRKPRTPKPKPIFEPVLEPAPVIVEPVAPAPKPLTARQARKKVIEINQAFDVADRAESVRRMAERDAIRLKVDRGEISWMEHNRLIKESNDAQAVWVETRLAERRAAMREVLKVADPITVDADWSKYKFAGKTPEQVAAVRKIHEQGIEDFRSLVSKVMEPVGEKANFDAGADPVTGRFPRIPGNRVIMKSTTRDRSFALGETVNMAFGTKEDTVVHELGHWLEGATPQVRFAIQAFYDKRTKGDVFEKLRDLFPGWNYLDHEITKKDKFLEPYMGKWYSDKNYSKTAPQTASEILSYGLELFHREAARLAEKDPEYFDFIYNLVRGIIKRR